MEKQYKIIKEIQRYLNEKDKSYFSAEFKCMNCGRLGNCTYSGDYLDIIFLRSKITGCIWGLEADWKLTKIDGVPIANLNNFKA